MRDERRPWIALAARVWASVRGAWRAGIAALPISAFLVACSAALPRPAVTQVSASDYVPVPFSPRPPPVEFIPPSPSKKAVWVDGSWEWSGNRYAWRYGAWMIPPANARRARWVVVRRPGDGQLFFAPSTWKDAAGNPIEDRSFMTALGPQARARTRPGGPPAGQGTRAGGAGATGSPDDEFGSGAQIDRGDSDDSEE